MGSEFCLRQQRQQNTSFSIPWLCDPLVLIMIPPNGIATGRSPCLHTQDEQQQTGRRVKLLHLGAKSDMKGSCSGMDCNPHFPTPLAAKARHQILILN